MDGLAAVKEGLERASHHLRVWQVSMETPVTKVLGLFAQGDQRTKENALGTVNLSCIREIPRNSD